MINIKTKSDYENSLFIGLKGFYFKALSYELIRSSDLGLIKFHFLLSKVYFLFLYNNEAKK